MYLAMWAALHWPHWRTVQTQRWQWMARQRRLKQLNAERAAESSRQADKKAAEKAAAEEDLASVEDRDVREGLGSLFRRGV